jgi:hypothetical protein
MRGGNFDALLGFCGIWLTTWLANGLERLIFLYFN